MTVRMTMMMSWLATVRSETVGVECAHQQQQQHRGSVGACWKRWAVNEIPSTRYNACAAVVSSCGGLGRSSVACART